jgi:hypothetical protein
VFVSNITEVLQILVLKASGNEMADLLSINIPYFISFRKGRR